MRGVLVRLHRWFGLAAAGFLFLAGLTGALIAWEHEIDAWLNPALYRAASAGPPLPPLELARAVEAADPRVQVRYLPLSVEPGRTLVLFVDPRVDARTGRPHAVDYNQVALDPASGRVQGRRLWGEVSLARENLMPFVYKLHYSLHLPAAGGVELGLWLMGLVAIGWVIDCAIALAISFPRAAQWRRSFVFRWRAGGHRLLFDVHRSGGVWLWGLLLAVAVTSVSMNLQQEVMRPLVAWFSPLSPSPFEGAAAAGPALPPEQVLARAEAHARRAGIREPAGGLLRLEAMGVYGVGFFQAGQDHGDGGLGNAWLYFDAATGVLRSAQLPGEGSAGDVFLQAMFPLHSGRIAGLPGRVAVSVIGLSVAVLSATGVAIWSRKRPGRA